MGLARLPRRKTRRVFEMFADLPGDKLFSAQSHRLVWFALFKFVSGGAVLMPGEKLLPVRPRPRNPFPVCSLVSF